jgi:flotillin
MVGTGVTALALFIASRYEKVGPNEVLIISGRRGVFTNPATGEHLDKNFRIYHGGGTFVLPVREKVNTLSVELMTLEIRTPEFFTKYGVPIIVDGIAQIKVRSDDPIATATAAEMFLSKSIDEMNEITHQMMQGHLRAVISTLPFEEIHANPEVFAQSVQRLTAEDLANMGIQVVSFTIREIQDPSGYLKALGRPQLAGVQKDAVLGEANAARDATKGKSLAEREATITSAKANEDAQLARISAEMAIANAQKEKDIKLHDYSSQVAQAKAASDLAYELQKAKTQQLLVDEQLSITRVERDRQIHLEDLEIQRREKELVHAIQKPAEAERYRIQTLAGAEQQRLRMLAEGEAEAARLRGLAEADVIRAKGEAEAAAIRQRSLAEAEGLKAKYLAEAEGMQQKAKAWQEYNAAAVSQMFIEKLPDIAAAVAAPLQKVDRITMINTGSGSGTGVERITKGVTDVLAQVPGVVEMLTGINLPDLLKQVPGLSATVASKEDGSQGPPALTPPPSS